MLNILTAIRSKVAITLKNMCEAFPNAPSWLVAPSSTSARELQIMFCSGSAAAYSCLCKAPKQASVVDGEQWNWSMLLQRLWREWEKKPVTKSWMMRWCLHYLCCKISSSVHTPSTCPILFGSSICYWLPALGLAWYGIIWPPVSLSGIKSAATSKLITAVSVLRTCVTHFVQEHV